MLAFKNEKLKELVEKVTAGNPYMDDKATIFEINKLALQTVLDTVYHLVNFAIMDDTTGVAWQVDEIKKLTEADLEFDPIFKSYGLSDEEVAECINFQDQINNIYLSAQQLKGTKYESVLRELEGFAYTA